MEKKEADIDFFVTNNSGSYISLGKDNFSHYNGVFFFLEEEMELYKTIEHIAIKEGKQLEGKFAFRDKTAIYESDKEQTLILTLDFRRIHDFDDQGRIYTITKNKQYTIVKYDKYENNSLQKIKETFYLAIKPRQVFSEIKILSEWSQKKYAYDSSRGTKSEFYVYKGLEIKTNKINLGFGKTENEAIKNADKNISFEETDKSILKIAEKSLDRLIVNLQGKKIEGIFAGFPWFYQIWGRDELISLGGLIASGKYNLSKKILMRNVDNLTKGFVPNRFPSSNLISIDSTGWMYKRIADLLVALHKNEKLGTHISKKELQIIYKKLIESIEAYKNRMKTDLIINNPLETWMDTADPEGKDNRSGARIEIQCLFLNMCSLASYLSKILDQDFSEYEAQQEVQLFFYTSIL